MSNDSHHPDDHEDRIGALEYGHGDHENRIRALEEQNKRLKSERDGARRSAGKWKSKANALK